MNATTAYGRADGDGIEARFARRIVAQLDQQSDLLGHDITERLRVGREQALARARQARAIRPITNPKTQIVGTARGTLSLGGSPSGWLRLASLLPLMVLVVGLLAIQYLHEQAEIRAAADVDTALLADDLPPEAYGDPGFAVFLKQPEP